MDNLLASAGPHIVCRVCLAPKPPGGEGSEAYISVSDKIENQTIASIIENLAGISCIAFENCPDEVCRSCAQDVYNALTTKNRCLKSDVALRQSRKRVNPPFYLNGVKIELVKCDPDLPVIDISDDRRFDESMDSPPRPSTPPQETPSNEDDFDFDFELSDLSDCDGPKKKSYVKRAKRNKKRATPIRRNHFCCRCPEIFQNDDLLMDHFVKCHLDHINEQYFLQSANSPDNFQCHLCRKVFKNRKGVKRHQYQQHAAKKSQPAQEFKCEICMRVYASKKTKIECEQNHAGTLQRLKCPHPGCNAVLKNKGNFKNHIRLHDPNDPNIFTCEICGKISKKLINHQKHLQSHSDIRNFECALCGKKLKYKFSMELHMRIHTGVRPYQCEICPNNYIHHTDLKRHEMSVHTGERPYKCQFAGCEKGFVKRSSLQSHEKAHDNVD